MVLSGRKERTNQNDSGRGGLKKPQDPPLVPGLTNDDSVVGISFTDSSFMCAFQRKNVRANKPLNCHRAVICD